MFQLIKGHNSRTIQEITVIIRHELCIVVEFFFFFFYNFKILAIETEVTA